ncbi:MAG: ABC transporter permease subunit [Alphaproteobacteria bacterium]|nr:ABC transporter permease subunit [Alphaproteobacteria bacterium]MDX5368979.1 ABC transporter permease subunit [Alphaproteobacteria bacterium]MDX5463674.1 ABC transporter permease subunit [Alphaproteobacteria bacterium]
MTRLGWIRLAVVAGFVLLIEVLCRTGVIGKLTMIPPSAMAVELWALLKSGKADADIVQTLRNVAVAFALSVVGGFVLGVGLHSITRLRRAVDPFLATYYAIPFFAFYPLLVSIFGLNAAPIILIGFLFGVVAMIINTINGLDRVPRVLLKTARVCGMDPVRTALMIKLPSAAPHLFTGAKLAIAYSFIGVIAAEFIMSTSGLGYSIAYAFNNFDNKTMYALMLFIITLVTVINAVFHVWERRIMARRGR